MNKVVKLFFVKIVFLITCGSLNSQPVTWMRYYDYNNWSNSGHHVIQTFEGGYAFYSETSLTDNFLKKNILFTKTDYLGNVDFEKLFTDSTPSGLHPTSFQQTDDSGYIMAGFTSQAGFLIKTDQYGNIQWRKDFTRPGGSSKFWTMKITLDKGYICGGDILTSNLRQYILKTDSMGNLQWDSVYLGSSVNDIIQSTNGFYYVTNGNIFRKLNSSGGIVWERDTSVSGLYIEENSNGYFYLLNGLNLSKYDSLGNVYWKKNYFNSFPASVNFQNLCSAMNTDLILSGFISDPYTIYPDCFLARVDTEGVVKNYKIITTGKKDYDYLKSIYPTADNGFICTGYTSFEGSRLYWNTIALKTDSSFNTTPIVGINNYNISSLSDFILFQNYPNPFNPSTTIKFKLGKDSKVTLNIYDISGKLVKTLINQILKTGEHEELFDGENYSSGIYFYSLIADDFKKIKKMILLK